MSDVDIVAIDTEYITLGQLLKALGYIQTGGQAKIYLASYPVILDGQEEQRRGKKLYPGSVVEFPHEGAIYAIRGASESDPLADHHAP
ncbi:S4 domain-containing protein YaaA [Aerococcus urinae]|uniref:S4 domain-containing protein YaaA n=1 Tax=Aerococcus mictus TaxID=2976810 RepID=A0A1E9PMR4_9LACT|nr:MULTISPECIES: S4 domain-containing protein YaaA [Aerococcus]KAA9291997.1 S4 domain-containing protein YaaA [Aerococcus mictus]MBU5610175.1 S4 domain-containing protein YaaA [Aerococcus urinae]MCY3034915.1 S4 domain-containing protein YaaA [Aerococcus mictus]MCY3063369.1 S4 domain-containing protein YaaA [Aerococcus mictus]MCY3066043.1 S4 domain-containing protein YaaA [Aerococcus mictus]